MRTLVVGLPLLALAAACEAAVLPHLRTAGGGGLNLVLLCLLGWTLAGDWNGGLVWGLIGGLYLDLLSGGPLGVHALALVITAYLASLTEGQLWRSHVLLPLAAALFGTVAYQALTSVALAVTGTAIDWGNAFAGVLIPTLIINLVLILPVYEGLRRLHDLIYPAAVKAP